MKWHSVFFLFLIILLLPLDVSANQTLTLEEIVQAALISDEGLKSLHWKQELEEARIREIQRSGGWKFYLETKHQWENLQRREKRDTTLDRSAHSFNGDLEEDTWFVQGGLQNTFFGPSRDRRSKIAKQELDQLDRLVTIWENRLEIAFEAAEAYLNLVDGVQLLNLIDRQIEYADRVAEIFKARSKKGEAIQLDVLEAQYDLSVLKGKKLKIENRTQRSLDYLQTIFNQPTLDAAQLARPEVPGSTEISNLDLSSLVTRAFQKRPDLHAADIALESASDFSKNHAKTLPDLRLDLGLRYRDHERDYLDEFRDDYGTDFTLGAKFTIPLSIQARNQARKERYEAEAQSRYHKLNSKKQKIVNKIRKRYEDYREALFDLKIQEVRLQHADENVRVTEVTAKELPEILGEIPEIQAYRSRAHALEVQSDLQRAQHRCTSALLHLAAETVDLLNDSLDSLKSEDN